MCLFYWGSKQTFREGDFHTPPLPAISQLKGLAQGHTANRETGLGDSAVSQRRGHRSWVLKDV